MPELDGLDATREIRAHERRNGGRLPILALTAHAMREDHARCLEAGMDGYVSKPIRSEELFSAIERVLAIVGDGGAPGRTPERRRPAATPASLLDENELLERVDGDRELLLDLVELFYSDLPQRLREADAAVASGDAPEVERIAHSLAGAIGNLAAHRALAAARRLEARAAARDQAALAPSLGELRLELGLLKPALRALVDKPDGVG
jgi:CheY-like chemotaxis protein